MGVDSGLEFPKENIINNWLEKHGNPEIDKQVEKEAKEILEYKEGTLKDLQAGEAYQDLYRSMTYAQLEVAVELWAEEKGILEKATPIKQALKTQEEVLELQNAIVDDDREEIQDALGDILVTIIIQAKMQGLDLLGCLQSAYDVISKRSGKMVKGQFLKDK